jgi:gas vesicle protein
MKEEILQVINENFTEMIPDMVNKNVQEKLKKFQDNKNREFEKAQEEIKQTKKHCIYTKVKQRIQLIKRYMNSG